MIDWRAELRSRRRQQQAAGILFAGAAFYFVDFARLYLSLNEQLLFSWGGLFLLMALSFMPFAKRQPWRLLIILLGAVLATRYLFWRTAETLIYTRPSDFVAMSAVYLAEVYAITVHFLGMLINVWPLDRKPPPLPEDTSTLPTVDVLIPTYNEDDEIIRLTAMAATQIDYPKDKLKIWILDDGGTVAKRAHPENGTGAWMRHFRLRRMADELGVGYITRSQNLHAKAGNINHALDHTSAELILILDCDHVPTQDILRNTVGFFIEDPKLFLVQTPHFFINATPVDKNLSVVSNMPHESDMFYRRIQTGMDFWNAAYFCGSAAVLRRTCLEETGGLCGQTITEDAETAFHLHSKGYNSVYFARPMVCGLSPETYDDYVVQRSRWAQGMVQLFLINNPARARGLTLTQRLAYLNACFFWFFSFARVIYFAAPAAFLVLGLNVYNASYLQIITFALPYVISTYFLMHYFYGDSRATIFSEVYESIQTMILIPALISVLINPYKPSFKVTPKGAMTDKEHLSPLSAPFVVVVMINLAALVLAIFKWFDEPVLREVILVTVGWCAYNLYLGLLALGAFWERKQIRTAHRIETGGEVQVEFPRMGVELTATIKDLSVTGVGFQVVADFPLVENERVIIKARDSYGHDHRFEADVHRAVRRNGVNSCGAEFVERLTKLEDVVNYIFGDSERWMTVWENKGKGGKPLRTSLRFLMLGLKGFKGATMFLLQYAWAVIHPVFQLVHRRFKGAPS